MWVAGRSCILAHIPVSRKCRNMIIIENCLHSLAKMLEQNSKILFSSAIHQGESVKRPTLTAFNTFYANLLHNNGYDIYYIQKSIIEWYYIPRWIFRWLGYPLQKSYLPTLAICSCNSVSFPSLEPLLLYFVKFFEARKASDFLEESVGKIIEARKMESDGSSLVSLHVCV